MDQITLNKILDKHQHWLNEDCKGWENMRANLSGEDLSNLDLSERNLTGIDFIGTKFSHTIFENTVFHVPFCLYKKGLNIFKGTNFLGATFFSITLKNITITNANFEGAVFTEVCFKNVNFERAEFKAASFVAVDFTSSRLSHAEFRGAYLYRVCLESADLDYADFSGAQILDSSFENATLEGAYFNGTTSRDTDFKDANLDGAVFCCKTFLAKNIPNSADIPMACPTEGSFIGWKRVENNKIVKLEIPGDAKRCSATGRKCRCDKAHVLGIYDVNHNLLEDKEAISLQRNLIYKVGEMAYPDSFDENRWEECTHGIHFFISFEEAVDY